MQRKKSEEGPGLILPRLILNDNEFLFLYLVSVGIHMCGDQNGNLQESVLFYHVCP